MYGTKYRGCRYSKAYEVFDEDHRVIAHSLSANQAREIIDKHLKEERKQDR